MSDEVAVYCGVCKERIFAFDHKCKPASTVHGAGSGDKLNYGGEAPTIENGGLGEGFTPPASPTVTETFAAKEACRIVNKFPQIEQMVMAPMLKMEIALALLRAAKRQQ